MKRFLVFIIAEYVRDCQAYLNAALKSDTDTIDEENEANWRDVNGDILVMDMMSFHIDDIKSNIRTFYPNASEKVFRILEIDGSAEVHSF